MFPYVWMIKYDSNDEKENGLYWQFLDTDKEEVRNHMTVGCLIEILEQIENPVLKEKMKIKIADTIEYSDLSSNFDKIIGNNILKQNDIEEMIGKYIEGIGKKIQKDGLEKFHQYSDNFWRCKEIIETCTKNDNEKQFTLMKQLLDYIKSFSRESDIDIISKINTDIIFHVGNEDVKNRLISEYYLALTEPAKKLVEYNQDKNYIRKKMEKFRGIKIGLKANMTIGCEIEANNEILKDLINIDKHTTGYHMASEPTIGPGNEFVSPIFHDSQEDVAMFCAVCETLSELGYYYDEQLGLCGGHINIGLQHLDTADAILNFYEIYGNAEEVLFHICNKEGQVIRQNISGYDDSFFQPISGRLGKKEFAEDISRSELIGIFDNDKKGSSSLFGITGKKASVCIRDNTRLEFRMPNGGADYQVWLDNIRLFGRIVEVAKEIDDITKNGPQNERDIQKLELKESLKEDKSLEEKMFDFMDLLFEDDEIKQIYMNRFYSIERATEYDWEKTGEYSREEVEQIRMNQRRYRPSLETFKMVDFERVYRTRFLENGEFNEAYSWIEEYIPKEGFSEKITKESNGKEQKNDERKESESSIDEVELLGRIVEGYTVSYGITTSDLRRTHLNLEMNQHNNRDGKQMVQQNKDEI